MTMRLIFHPKVWSDIDEIMGHYERVASRKIADEFYSELQRFISQAEKKPEKFAIRERDFRRVNLDHFPYHFLFRVAKNSVRILVVRHNKRHPLHGISRR